MKKYEAPMAETISLRAVDVVAASGQLQLSSVADYGDIISWD